MSSDKSSSAVGGTAAAIGSVGNREGGLSAAMKRAAVDNASVSVRLKDDKGEALDAALTDSNFMAKTDGDLKALRGEDLIEEMRNNPLTQAKSGTAWAQVNIAKAGLDQELDKLIEGTPIVRERAALHNIENLMSSKTLTELSPLQVRFLQDNLKELRLYKGKNDGDFTNPQMVAALDNLVKGKDTLQKVMDRNGGRLAIDFAWSVRHPEFNTGTKPAVSGESKIMDMFKQARDAITTAPVAAAAAQDPRVQAPAPTLV